MNQRHLRIPAGTCEGRGVCTHYRALSAIIQATSGHTD